MASTWLLHALYAGLLTGLVTQEQNMTTRESNNDTDNIFVTSTVYGKVRGKKVTTDYGDVIQFLGIPYARPPIGSLRFQRPLPPDPWTGDRDAFNFSSICTQRVLGKQGIIGNEDCLYLNVYLPTNVDISIEPLSVMVWIHGGGYYIGAGSTYGGSGLANQGVVIVTINYRLDAFGFLSTEDDVIPGNFGMMDQILALKWVQQNIASFGGDPNKVTIFGESAGASSVSLLLLSPLAKGLFQKAIMESGSSLAPWAITHPATSVKPRHVAHFIGNSVGCIDRNSDSLLQCLQKIDQEILLQATLLVEGIVDSNNIVMKPRVENTYGFLPDLPVKLLAGGKFHQVDTIHGFNAQEMGYAFINPRFKTLTVDDFRDAILGNMSTFMLGSLKSFSIPDKDFFLNEAKRVYKINATSNPTFIRDQAIQATSNLAFVGPTMNEIQFLTSRGENSTQTTRPSHYLYRFNYRPSYIGGVYPPWIKNVHGHELAFLFDKELLFVLTNDSSLRESDEDKKIKDFMMRTWTNFAKSGDPNSPTTSDPSVNIRWPTFTGVRDDVLTIDSMRSVGSFGKPEVTNLSWKLITNIDTALDKSDWIVG